MRAIDASHLFAPLTIHAVIHRNSYLRNYAHEFIRTFAPKWDKQAVHKAMQE